MLLSTKVKVYVGDALSPNMSTPGKRKFFLAAAAFGLLPNVLPTELRADQILKNSVGANFSKKNPFQVECAKCQNIGHIESPSLIVIASKIFFESLIQSMIFCNSCIEPPQL